MQIEMVSIDEVKAYQGNPREIPAAAVTAVAESIRQFGFKVPVITDAAGVLIAGHTRLQAARKLGLTEVPVVRADDLTPEQVRAFRVVDNKVHELSGWDLDLLPIELSELQKMDFDLGALGFSEDELATLLGGGPQDGLTDPNAVPEPPDKAMTRPGDLYVLGQHRLLCGDAGKAKVVDRLLDGATIHLVNTDPPYNVNVEPRSSTAIAAGESSYWDASLTPEERRAGIMHHQKFDVARGVTDPKKAKKKMRPKDRRLAGDFVSDEKFAETLLAWFGNLAQVLSPGGPFYIWGGYANLGNYPIALKKCGLYFAQAIVWDKEHPVLTRKDFMCSYELAFYGWREGAGHKFYGPSNVFDLWHIKKIPPQKMIHLTQKPVELAVRAMEYSSRPGENVLDLFAGSGSTLIAAEQAGRKAFLMEVDALYCDVILTRWEEFTGQKAKRAKRRKT